MTVRLEARHHGGEVWITVSDDGKGLDRERILKKAVERGLADEDTAASWPDSKVYGLVFQPGFSTADQVTEVSGRGVGMDVVLRNIQALKGRVEIASQAEVGATFTLRIPLTLAIIEGMLVEVAQSRFLIPLLSIRESFQCRAGMIHTLPDGREVTHVRGGFLPLVRIAEVQGLAHERQNDKGLLVIVEHEGRSAALHVDALLGQRQTVIKPLPDFFGEHPAIAGCSILSNGEIALILELGGLVPPDGGGHASHNAHRDIPAAHAA
ncbi:MAG: chemotaxis protein CheW [Myxococcota bacterium]